MFFVVLLTGTVLCLVCFGQGTSSMKHEVNVVTWSCAHPPECVVHPSQLATIVDFRVEATLHVNADAFTAFSWT